MRCRQEILRLRSGRQICGFKAYAGLVDFLSLRSFGFAQDHIEVIQDDIEVIQDHIEVIQDDMEVIQDDKFVA